MSVVYIIVEGQTEEEFINNSLAPWLRGMGISNVVPVIVETSAGHFGGDVSFSRYRDHVLKLLSTPDKKVVVTSLIDLYQLRNDFPGYETAMTIFDKNDRVAFLENQISVILPDKRFIPYIQLHEFEGLLFAESGGFNYLRLSPARLNAIQEIIIANPNPELINDGLTTAPSKRLQQLIPRYKKTFHGPIVALENGMQPLLNKCPRFKAWTDKIVSQAR